MPCVNYAIYVCSSSKTTRGVSVHRSNTWGKTFVAVISQNRVILMASWKGKLKTEICILS